MSTLEEKIRALPPELQQEVEKFMESLLRKRDKKGTQEMKLNWRGGLKYLKDKYTSVELQHQIFNWEI